ncbi:rhomboid family intramembrane serine protease [Shewanella sp. 202IG2-18]|uniref:rhomboid family intramembrane serine protease n=1 Tax=Parashewanella hymeniacidonis TaxID=2807618 RepID=UPI00195FCFBF|nr:rhomboid family intramembrane serine protease [Parashewanella hymeniacidonis]MBM7073180.1 rhomboid family intramembrane serine protease [Parashewanella hymeniacidonis]
MQSSIFKNYKFKLTFLFIFSLLFLFLGIISPEKNGFKISLVGLIALLFVAIDYKLIKLDCDVLDKRKKFVIQLKRERKNILISILIISIAVYLFQHFLMKELGTLEIVMIEYGIVYQKINEGEKWRLLIGFLFHSSISHWLINIALLIGFCALARPYSITYIFIVFFVGCILSSVGAYFLYIFGFSNNDGFLGVSGGVMAIAGAVIVATTISFKNYFPKYFYISFISFVSSIIFIDFITTTFMTSFSHLVGFLSGILISLVSFKLSKIKF